MNSGLGQRQTRSQAARSSHASRDEAALSSVNLSEKYQAALEFYVSSPDEAALGRAYDLGRAALAQGISLMEIAGVHHDALRNLVFSGTKTEHESRARSLQACADFLAETVSPYEMAHRGFQDAITALRQMNDRLEQQIKGIAYAVHDEAGQLLVAVHLALASLANEVREPQQKQIIEIEGLLNEVEKQLRQYSHELRPTILDDLGWVPALRFLAESVGKRANVPIHVEAKITERLPSPCETAIYRVVQEAVNNAIKHSGAKNIWISAKKDGEALCCTVTDDGCGFDPQALRAKDHRRGLGLTAMHERLNAIGGTLNIESTRGKGTAVQIRLALENTDADANRTR